MEKTVIQQEFDELAREYESNRLSGWYQAHGAEILDACPDLEEGDILDIGCGTGHFLRQYLKKNPSVRGVGLDMSASMVNEARRLAEAENITNVSYMTGDWELIDIEDLGAYNFRIIVCANTFHYFANPQAAIAKIHHLLAKDGFLYTLERDKSRSLLTSFWGFLHSTWIKDHVIFYSGNDLIRLFENAGFTGISVIRSIRRYFWKKKLFTSIVLLECHKKTLRQNHDQSDITGRKAESGASR
ncbi:MAG TPA: hypothetical protein DDW55_01700 [Gammaproteobacteria bacterium]|nr:hypothetical protein [Gammaproteobacteria bacterium]